MIRQIAALVFVLLVLGILWRAFSGYITEPFRTPILALIAIALLVLLWSIFIGPVAFPLLG